MHVLLIKIIIIIRVVQKIWNILFKSQFKKELLSEYKVDESAK